ncbi:MAG: hypothetical protein Q7R65_02745 [bacterium]|nr:hypothetical protein [bacterium]
MADGGDSELSKDTNTAGGLRPPEVLPSVENLSLQHLDFLTSIYRDYPWFRSFFGRDFGQYYETHMMEYRMENAFSDNDFPGSGSNEPKRPLTIPVEAELQFSLYYIARSMCEFAQNKLTHSLTEAEASEYITRSKSDFILSGNAAELQKILRLFMPDDARELFEGDFYEQLFSRASYQNRSQQDEFEKYGYPSIDNINSNLEIVKKLLNARGFSTDRFLSAESLRQSQKISLLASRLVEQGFRLKTNSLITKVANFEDWDTIVVSAVDGIHAFGPLITWDSLASVRKDGTFLFRARGWDVVGDEIVPIKYRPLEAHEHWIGRALSWKFGSAGVRPHYRVRTISRKDKFFSLPECDITDPSLNYPLVFSDADDFLSSLKDDSFGHYFPFQLTNLTRGRIENRSAFPYEKYSFLQSVRFTDNGVFKGNNHFVFLQSQGRDWLESLEVPLADPTYIFPSSAMIFSPPPKRVIWG